MLRRVVRMKLYREVATEELIKGRSVSQRKMVDALTFLFKLEFIVDIEFDHRFE